MRSSPRAAPRERVSASTESIGHERGAVATARLLRRRVADPGGTADGADAAGGGSRQSGARSAAGDREGGERGSGLRSRDASRRFRIMMSDYAAVVLMTRALPAIQQRAPKVAIE